MLTIFEEWQNIIIILIDFTAIRRTVQVCSSLSKAILVLFCIFRFHGCWCCGNARSQGINNSGIDLVYRLKLVTYLSPRHYLNNADWSSIWSHRMILNGLLFKLWCFFIDYKYRYIQIHSLYYSDLWHHKDKQYSHTSNGYSHPAPGGLISHFYLNEIQS